MGTRVIIFIAAFILILLPTFFNLIWLSGLLIGLISYGLILFGLSKVRFGGIKVIRSVFLIFGIVIISVAVRVYGFEVYAIPTPSMEKTILVGDKVLVSKLKHGPSLPRSPFEIPWVNLLFYFNEAYAGTEDSVFWDYQRLEGFGQIKRGDVLVFDHPRWNQVFIKRCVALPGDTLEIRDGLVYINGNRYKDEDKIRRPWRIQVNDPNRFRQIMREDKVWGKWEKHNVVEISLTEDQMQEYATYDVVDFIEPKSLPYDPNHEVFPGRSYYHHSKWSIDNYGPYVVPYQGMKIDLNAITDNHYWFMIKYREGNTESLNVRDGVLYFGDTIATTYEFKKDYYFMMGDNRHDSNDSRYWGPIQEDMIIGVANTILFSNNKEGFQWGRVFKNIN